MHQPRAHSLAPQTNPPHAHTTRQPASRHTLTHRTHAPHAYPASAQPRPELRLEEAGAVGAARVGREVAKVGEAAHVNARVGTSPPGADRRATRVEVLQAREPQVGVGVGDRPALQVFHLRQT